jgi:hypothetical protein
MQIKKFYLLLIIAFTFFAQNAWGQLFEQNFSSSSTASDYVNSSSPNNGQFTQITATSGSSASATGNKLNFTRSTGGSSNFVRSVGFSPAPSALMIRFDISVSGNSTAKSGQGVFYLGTSTGANAFDNDNVAPSNANSHSRLGISWTTTAGQFAIRKMKSAAADGPNLYTGTQTVIWVVNNSGSTLNYRAPNGSNSSVANDKFDVWVGTTLEFDELDAETSGVTGIDKIKFVSLGENGTISIDNILIDPIPVAVTSGTASNITSSGFRANWTAVSGVTGYRVDVSTANDFSSFVSGYNNLYVSGQSTNYLDISGLNSSTQYYYRVRAASQYTVDEFAGANSSSQSATTSSSGSTPPTLTAAGSATVDAAFDVTFTDDATWRAAITGITIGGTPLTAGWSESSGKITFTPSSSTPAGLLQTAGSKSIVVAATGYTDATVTQSIGFGAATKLAITQQPTAPASNGAVLAQQPVVVIQDQYGNTVTSSSATVTAAVGSGTWTIGGTTNPSASSGVATFTNLTATSAAAVTGATIDFTATGLTGITSATFNIPAPAPANDLCGSAVALTIDAAATNGTLTAATYTTFTGASSKKDVWYKFTPACSGNNTITVTFSSGPDLDFQVFSNSNACPTNNSQSVATSQSGNATDETYNSYTFLKGVTYYIRVYEYADVASDFTIRVTSPTPATQAVTTNAASSITASGATLNGQISTVGVCPTSNGKGFVYAETSVNSDPLHGGTGVTTVAVSANTIPQNLSAYTNTPSLSAATGYSFKAYVIDEDGNYTYGSVQTFTTLATQPSTAASAVTLTARTTTSISLSWTNGNGAGRIVVARLTSSSNVAAADGNDYTFSTSSFTDAGNGTTGTGNIIVYKGTGNSVTISDLNVGTSYGFYVYEYNGSSNTINYASAANLTAQYTLAAEPTVQATISSITPQSNGNLVINFAAGTGGTGRMVVVRQGSAVDFTPDDANTSYDVGTDFSSGTKYGASSDNKVVYVSTGSSITVSGLTPATVYHVAVFEYNGTTTPPRNYLTTLGAGNTGNATTFATQPSTAVSNLAMTGNTTTSISLSWTNGNGAGRIIVARESATTNEYASDGTDYSYSSSSFTDAGNGTIGTGNIIVYKGTGNSVTVTDLTPGTAYRFYAYEYNGSSNTINYTNDANLPVRYTLSLEPTAHAASFTATATSSTNIDFNFSAANTITNATGYLILRKPTAFTGSDYPQDRYAYSVGASIGGATVTKIITDGSKTSDSYTSNADETWYFLLVPFNWDGANGATRNYYINPTIPTSNTSTPSGVSDVVAVASSSPATISSIINDAAPLTSSTGVQVWQITVRDGGASMNDADVLPTKVSGITFTTASGNGVTWNTAIKTAALFNGSTFIATATSIDASNIIFSGLSESVADNASSTYSLRISLNETLGTGNDDGDYFRFQLSQANITTVADGTSSSTTNFTAITTASGGTENKIDIVATKLYFVQQPTASTTFNDISPAVKVHATDANNNIDSNYTTNVQITATGAVLRNSPVTQTTVGGLSTFSGLQFATPGTGVTLTATSGSLTNAVSNGFTITLGSPIVALAQWTFETSVPTSAGPHSPEIGSGQATGNHASGSTTYNNPVGNGSAESFSSDRWASGDYYQFKTSSYGYQNITIDFDQTGSNTGPRDFKIQYSTDGSTFTDLSGGSYQLTADSWSSSGDPKTASSRTFDLSSVTALNNQANIYIRLTVSSSTAIDGGSIATTGTGRVDNVTIKGAAITFTWNGAGDGINWNDAANWDCNCGLTPTINNPVVIPNGANVVLNTDYTARNLQLQATSSLKIAPNKTLMVEGYADFNGQHVTVQSDATGTGMIGQVSGYIEDANNVTVERYISASSNRAYRLLTPSVTTTNYIRDNWQEGTNNVDEATNSNPNPGYGTHITGVGGASNGFDPTQNNQSSLYKLVSNAWVAISNTNATILEADKAYLLFVRGSRDNINTINTLTGSSNTKLRVTGTIKQGSQTFSSLPASSFNLITNPYAAPLDWGEVYAANSSNFENYIHVWDPNIGTRGGYVAVEDDGTTSVASDLTQHIQSGQAFFVRTKTGIASLNLLEENKATINNLNVFKTSSNVEKLNVQLRFTKDNVNILADGVLARFDSAYNNEVDSKDALQITNWDEDIALTRGSSKLSIESRNTITTADTLFLRIANLKVSQGVYNWVMVPTNFTNKNFQPYLEDDFTGTRKPISLNDTTKIEFNVTNNVASTAANRFRIVFAERKLYYSKANNLHADDLNSWSSTTDGNGTSPTSFNELANYTIQQGHTLQLNGTLNLTEGVLTIQPNAGINNAGLLTVAYNVENNGAINGEGVLQLNGLIKQYLTGNGNYSKLELNNNAGAEIQIENNAFITDAYIPTTGILKTHNNLILKSTALKTASISIGNTTGNYINGSIKVERYIPAKATRKWSFITSPLTQSIANGWQQQIHITGAGVGGSVCPIPTTHSNGFDATLTNASNIYTYNAANTSGQRWVSLASTISDFTNAGQAFRVNIRGDRNLGCNLLDGTITSPNEVTLVSSGILNNEAKNAGNFDIAFNNNGINNYIFIGNPYPSAINFSLLQSTNSAVIQNNYAIYIPENNAGIYTYWDGYSNTYTGGIGYNNLVGNSIASGQSVFVQSAVAGNVVLHFEENIKSEENSVGYFKNNLLKNKIKINYLNSAGIKIDEAIIRYLDEENVNNTSIGKLDIPSINSGTFISSLKNNTSIAVHSRLLSTLTKDEVWLNIGATQSGNYTLNFSEFNEFTDADIYLIDHLTNTTQNIKQNASYNFSVDVNHIATKGSNRFSLVFTKKIVEPTIVYNNIKIYPNPANSTANLLLPENSSYTITILDLYGKNIKQIHSKGGVCKINVSLLSAGTYIVEILDDKGKKAVEKLIKTSN